MHGKRNLEVNGLSWIRDLYETYENNQSEVAKHLESSAVLLPIAHSTQNAQIEIIIDKQGNFIRAKEVGKEDTVTIIPVTEDSGTRTSGNAPHPLMDKLEYIAGDYEQVVGKGNTEKYQKYIQGVASWVQSAYTTSEVEAIYTYVKQGQVMRNLVESKVLELEESGASLSDKKINGIAQAECFVRFSIQPSRLEEIGEQVEVYKNTKVFDKYIQYYVSQQESLDLCYVTGKEMNCSSKQPSKIRHAGDKSKLISGNDTSGFTYKGRFTKATEAASVGYEVSQKAHNALRWLIAKQGFAVDEMTVVAWEKSGKKILSPMLNSWDAMFDEDEPIPEVTTNEAYAQKIALAAKGYGQDLKTEAEVIVLGLEAATTGRLSISFYRTLKGSEFMNNLLAWYNTCFWCYRQKKYKQSNEWINTIGTPSLKEIAKIAFGDKNDKLLKSTIERLLPCIIDKKKFPRDITKAALVKVANPNSYESQALYQKAVAITCALIRKSRYDYEREEWEVALDRKNTDRSYVYGRLLAAAQKLEEVALYQAGEAKRATAAERFTQQFVRRPAKTWKIINDALRPYIIRLKATGHTWYIKELQEIYDLIEADAFSKQQALSELYLLGYNCQLNSYNKGKEKNNEGENE